MGLFGKNKQEDNTSTNVRNDAKTLYILERNCGASYVGLIKEYSEYEKVFITKNDFLFENIKKYTDKGYLISCVDSSRESEFLK